LPNLSINSKLDSMKPTLFSNKSFLIKISFLVAINLLFIVDGFSQAGQKWGTNGNNTTTGDFIGTTNNEDLIFKTNNTTAFKIKANGNLIIKSLDNQGTGIVTFDNNGKIQPLVFSGNSNEVLYANGTWGVLPNLPSLSWQQNGSDIYYLNGKVGIGTTNPLVNLDVIGDARISNNLYVGGGIIITDKVNANTEVKTASINADSIKMDSTKAVYGFSNFKNDVKLDSKLQVIGDVKVNGNLKAGTINISSATVALSPCLNLIGLEPDGDLVQMNSNLEINYDPNSPNCPEPIIIPFTWQTYGNHVTNDNRWIGTIENFDFRIKTNNALRMTVKKDGKVGIGTGTPDELLDVNGNAKVRNTFEVIGNSIFYDRVGIGTNAPSAKIEIRNNNNTATPGLLVASSFINTSTTAEIANIISQVDSDSRKAFVVANGNGVYTENFVVFGDGHVFARDIKVSLDPFLHPDFVFEKNYNLKSLKEVELFINTNKHLPGVPSAAEVEQEKGITLGEMSEIQLQKIEELTLYIIDLNKKLEELKNTVDIQKTQINELQNK